MPGARARGHAVQHELLRTVRGALFGQRVSSRVVVIINQAPPPARPPPVASSTAPVPSLSRRGASRAGIFLPNPFFSAAIQKIPDAANHSFMLYRKHFSYGSGFADGKSVVNN